MSMYLRRLTSPIVSSKFVPRESWGTRGLVKANHESPEGIYEYKNCPRGRTISGSEDRQEQRRPIYPVSGYFFMRLGIDLTEHLCNVRHSLSWVSVCTVLVTCQKSRALQCATASLFILITYSTCNWMSSNIIDRTHFYLTRCVLYKILRESGKRSLCGPTAFLNPCCVSTLHCVD
jgi:hypothetical protein